MNLLNYAIHEILFIAYFDVSLSIKILLSYKIINLNRKYRECVDYLLISISDNNLGHANDDTKPIKYIGKVDSYLCLKLGTNGCLEFSSFVVSMYIISFVTGSRSTCPTFYVRSYFSPSNIFTFKHPITQFGLFIVYWTRYF